MPVVHEWIRAARRELSGLQRGNGSWGYRAGGSGCVEPTALATLALGPRRPEALRAAGWLASLQQPEGSLGLSETERSPGWMTPFAMLVWQATRADREPIRRASAWLLRLRGKTIPKRDDPEHIVGHDTLLVGWPWVADTHSWLEPTALAVLALGLAGHGEHPRVLEGLRLIRDRAIAGGGWNYGNKAVFGRVLRPQPAPTGLALLALAGIDGRAGVVEPAIAYLRRSLPGVRASSSLGWGLIGLAAWGETVPDASGWLASAHQSVSGRPDAAVPLAMLLLAADPETPRLFGRGPLESAQPSDAGAGESDLEAIVEGGSRVERE